jgi:small subunit ribosomal protein S9
MDTPQEGRHQSVGRRKSAVARVRLFPGQAQMTVNGKPISDYFKGQVAQKAYQKPFELTKTLGKMTGTVKIVGGGPKSQLDALVHGIAKVLEISNSAGFRAPLKSAGLLTRDARVRERRKFGRAGKARALKSSPKR